ncbi:uncharacterized protein LOC114937960 [Nylanderia fulva]|uniref:uncharacterized protein LOC114937960 n=1 Tax=Nylanderia fulva TaxID=613905 RepID=UPI0010FB2545|nr:uncharacterized protein LOC114937960 [Nylanderia fulva]
MQKLESRKWFPAKESFDDYAIDKLAMMHRLDLPESDRIQLLIGGIQQTPLKATALSLTADTMDVFLEKMRTIAQGMAETDRRTLQLHPQVKDKQAKDTCKTVAKGVTHTRNAEESQAASTARKRATAVHAVKKANLNPRIARWTLALQNYTFDISHRPGNRMIHADALSRSVALVDELPLERRLEFLQLADPEILKLSNELELEENDKFALIDGSSNRLESETQLYPLPKSPLELIHIDHFGPLQETVDGYKHIFLVIDAFIRFTWLYATKSTGAKEAMRLLDNLFSIFGKPVELVSGRGSAFTSNEFINYLQKQNIKHRKVAVAAPWANGMIERVNRFLETSLTKHIDSQIEWKQNLSEIQYVINNTHHSTIKATPSKLLLGYEQRNHKDHAIARITKALHDVDQDLESDRSVSRDTALQTTDMIRNYNKIYKDKHSIKPTKYKKGDYVMIRNDRNKVGVSSKLKPNYKGPYLVAKSLGSNRYVITDVPGFNLKQKPMNTVMSSDRIKPWIKVTSPVNN